MTEQHGRPVASYKTYWEAERAVDHRPDHGFPVEGVAIIGQDVRPVEQVIGRMCYGQGRPSRGGERCAPRCPDRTTVRPCELARPRRLRFLALCGLIFGAVVGALFGMPFQGRRQAFFSLRSMQSSR
ncbi:general stress protein [Streptomyces sp. NPDC007148]|uniref:general stress protein n=1 Tax=unclassified Streptomyces TaxID=2593676 RepID=UPI003693673A